MRISKLRLAAVALISGITLGGCTYGFGDPYGSYGGLGVGYGNYGYGDYGYGYGGYPYGGYGYGGYPYGGYGYGNTLGYGYGGYPFGWYDGWYYPGSGYYVYDRDRHRRQITDVERQYWREKFGRMTGTTGTTTTTATTATTSSITPRENWSGFKRIRTRSVDTSNISTTSRGSDRSRWNRPSTTTTTSTSNTTTTRSTSRSSDFMSRHAPKNED